MSKRDKRGIQMHALVCACMGKMWFNMMFGSFHTMLMTTSALIYLGVH
jgi:hypothetical protein